MSDIESKLRQRLSELRAEYDKGQEALQGLESQAANLRATLLRISGAVQVLQETLGDEVEAGEVVASEIAASTPPVNGHAAALPPAH